MKVSIVSLVLLDNNYFYFISKGLLRVNLSVFSEQKTPQLLPITGISVPKTQI